MTSVSAAIVSFNSGTHLEACVASVRASLHGLVWDGAIVDNASADGSDAALGRAGHEFAVIRNPANVGFAKAINQAIAATSGALVLIVNPDATLAPDVARRLIEELDRHPECALAGPRVHEAAGRVQGSARGDPDMLTGLFGRTALLTRLFPRAPAARRNVRTDIDPADGSVEVDWVSGACMLARRRDLVAVGGFDEQYFLYWEDADLCRRLRDAGRSIRYVPSATVMHHTGRSSETVRPLAIRAFHRSAYLYYATHVARGWLYPLRPLAWLLLRLRCWWKLAAACVTRPI